MTLNEQLVTGALLELEVPSQVDNKQIDKYHVVIDKPFKDGIVTITAPMKQGRVVPIQKGTVIKIIFSVSGSTSDDAYSVTCRVSDRHHAGKFNTLSLELTSSPKKVQRREYFRFSIVKKVEFIHDGQRYEMLTKNISATGVRGICNKKIPDGDICIIHLPIEDGIMSLRSEVVFSSPSQDSHYKSDLRFRFVDINEKDKSKITHYIFQQQSDMVRKNMDESGLNKNFVHHEGSLEFGEIQMSAKDYIPPFSWGITIIILGLFLRARPEKQNGLDKFWGYLRDSTWNELYLNLLAIVCLIQIAFCAYGIFIARQNNKPRNASLIINIGISAFLLLLYVYLYSLA
ncbi:MAG: flagellar brake protein [Clostridia bacterium]|nr:flagellar brake protein [Clostridia bacterium]